LVSPFLVPAACRKRVPAAKAGYATWCCSVLAPLPGLLRPAGAKKRQTYIIFFSRGIHMKKKVISAALAGTLAVSLLSACGASNEPQNISDVSSAASSEATSTTASSESTGDAAQELTFVLSNIPDGLDPSVTNNSFAQYVLINCFEGLVTYDSTGTLVPGNAESWDISDDGLTYTFHLRDGLKWSDGSDLTAEDYVYTIQRVLTPATAAQYVSMATDYIKNAQEYYDGTATADDLGVKALDDKTLEITLVQPTSYFIDILSMWTFSPVQKATVEANGDKWSTEADTYICNGPFKIASMSMNENVILEKNENYWDAENVSLQKVTFRYVLDQATALTAYESGEVDGVASIPSSDFARLKAENAGVQTSPSYGTVYYDFNCSAEPVNNVLVRKAICLAIDRQSIIDNVVQVDAQPAYSFLAPGYSVDGKDITEGRESFGLSATADVEGAQAALAEAGYPNGEGFPTLTLSYYDNDTVKKVVEAMAEMLKNNLNINVEVSSNEWSIFYDDVQKGNYQVAAMGWSADYVNPMSFLPLCKTGDSSNNLFYSNADYDALVDQVKAENDPAKAAELTLQADAIVSNDYAVLPLYYKSNNYLMHDNISGFYMTASGNLFFKDVKVG